MTYEAVKSKNRIETQTEFYEHQLRQQTRAILYFLLVGIPAIIFNVGLLVVIAMTFIYEPLASLAIVIVIPIEIEIVTRVSSILLDWRTNPDNYVKHLIISVAGSLAALIFIGLPVLLLILSFIM